MTVPTASSTAFTLTLSQHQILIGVSKGVRLAQGSRIKITYKPDNPPIPVKVDGEPWLQEEPAEITVQFLRKSPVLLVWFVHHRCARTDRFC
jgi:ABC-type amino acid transport system permease subunit